MSSKNEIHQKEKTNENLISNECEIIIEKPINEVYQWVVYKPLEKQINGTKKLPGVIETKPLNNIKIGEIGHLRLVCLSDGNTAIEEHTSIDKKDDKVSTRYFSYFVSSYTLNIAKNIEYGKGEWWFSPDGNKTQIKWRYSFKLDKNKILGRIGCFGRGLFKYLFIKTSYNEFMIETLIKLKEDLERKLIK